MTKKIYSKFALFFTITSLLLLSCGVVFAKETKKHKPTINVQADNTRRAQLKKEWDQVKLKYPLVAAAYLETVETLVEYLNYDLVYKETGGFRIIGDAKISVGPDCSPCKLAKNDDDIGRYIDCLIGRIGCLGR